MYYLPTHICSSNIADPSLNSLTSGPYWLIFSAFVPFFFDIPISTRFRVSGLRFSDKTFIYLAGLQVINFKHDDNLFPPLNFYNLNAQLFFPIYIFPSSPCTELLALGQLGFLFFFCIKLRFSLAASLIILEEIYYTGDMWHSCGFLISVKFFLHPKIEGDIMIHRTFEIFHILIFWEYFYFHFLHILLLLC